MENEQQIKDILIKAGGLEMTSGDKMAETRREIMRLTGVTLPKSKCGYNLVRSAVFAFFGIKAETLRDEYKALYTLIHRGE